MRSQSALEFLTTYGWAFIIIAIFLSVVLIFVSSKGSAVYVPPVCYISPGFPCVSAYASTNTVSSLIEVIFVNELGSPISFASNSFIVKPSLPANNYVGNCMPANVVYNGNAICTAYLPYSLTPGTQITPIFSITYAICSGKSCSGYVYNTSGSASVSVVLYPSSNILTPVT